MQQWDLNQCSRSYKPLTMTFAHNSNTQYPTFHTYQDPQSQTNPQATTSTPTHHAFRPPWHLLTPTPLTQDTTIPSSPLTNHYLSILSRTQSSSHESHTIQLPCTPNTRILPMPHDLIPKPQIFTSHHYPPQSLHTRTTPNSPQAPPCPPSPAYSLQQSTSRGSTCPTSCPSWGCWLMSCPFCLNSTQKSQSFLYSQSQRSPFLVAFCINCEEAM